MHCIHHQAHTKQQRGVALILALIILMVLTLFGITAMNTSNLQLLMTGNTQYQTVALNQAELTIRLAENRVLDIVGAGSPPTSGYYDVTPGNTSPIDLSTFGWADNDTVVSGDSKYIIEYTGSKTLPPESLAWRQGQGIAGDRVYVFRITAQSPAARGAMRYVQSIFVTQDSPL